MMPITKNRLVSRKLDLQREFQGLLSTVSYHLDIGEWKDAYKLLGQAIVVRNIIETLEEIIKQAEPESWD